MVASTVDRVRITAHPETGIPATGAEPGPKSNFRVGDDPGVELLRSTLRRLRFGVCKGEAGRQRLGSCSRTTSC